VLHKLGVHQLPEDVGRSVVRRRRHWRQRRRRSKHFDAVVDVACVKIESF
jgi:hypothetical protein